MLSQLPIRALVFSVVVLTSLFAQLSGLVILDGLFAIIGSGTRMGGLGRWASAFCFSLS